MLKSCSQLETTLGESNDDVAMVGKTKSDHCQFGCRYMVRENVKQAQTKVRAKIENVSGVQLPAFDMVVDGQNGTWAFNKTLPRYTSYLF